jgi:HEAT repeat protein
LEKYQEWRIRLKVSEQLRRCSEYFDKEFLMKSAKSLVMDRIAIVRKDAAQSFADLMDEEDISVIKEMSESRTHWLRATAAWICGRAREEMLESCLPVVARLCKDRVPNVRIAAANALDRMVRLGNIADEFVDVLKLVKGDVDVDVRNVFRNGW